MLTTVISLHLMHTKQLFRLGTLNRSKTPQKRTSKTLCPMSEPKTRLSGGPSGEVTVTDLHSPPTSAAATSMPACA